MITLNFNWFFRLNILLGGILYFDISLDDRAKPLYMIRKLLIREWESIYPESDWNWQ